MKLFNVSLAAGTAAALTMMSTFPMKLPVAEAAVRTVSITIIDTGFVPNHVIALVSQPVRLNITNQGHQIHQFSISSFRIYTQNLKPGANSTIQFSPWKVGRFQMMSDPSGQDKPEFTGAFLVTDQK